MEMGFRDALLSILATIANRNVSQSERATSAIARLHHQAKDRAPGTHAGSSRREAGEAPHATRPEVYRARDAAESASVRRRLISCGRRWLQIPLAQRNEGR